MKAQNVFKKGLNVFVDMIISNSTHSYAVNDSRLANFGKSTFLKRAKTRKGYGLFS